MPELTRSIVTEDEVLGDRHLGDRRRSVPVLGNDADACRRGRPGEPAVDARCRSRSTEPRRQRHEARQEVGERALPVAVGAREPDDLAAVHVEAQSVEQRAPVGRVHVRVADGEDHVGPRGGGNHAGWFVLAADVTDRGPDRSQRHRSSDHLARQLVGGRGDRVVRARRPRRCA